MPPKPAELRLDGHPELCGCFPCYEWRAYLYAERARRQAAAQARRRARRSTPEGRAKEVAYQRARRARLRAAGVKRDLSTPEARRVSAASSARWRAKQAEKLAAGLLVHGKPSTYDAGCRCVPCTASKTAAKQASRRAAKKGTKRRPLIDTDPRHGTTRGYQEGCRLECCRAAHAEECRALRASRAGTLPADDPRHGTRAGYDGWGCRLECCQAWKRSTRARRVA